METWKYKVGLIELTSWLKPLFGIFLGGSLVFPTLITSYHGWYLQEWEPKACSDSIVKSLVAVVGSPVIGFFSDWMWFFRYLKLFPWELAPIFPDLSQLARSPRLPKLIQLFLQVLLQGASGFFLGEFTLKIQWMAVFWGIFVFTGKPPWYIFHGKKNAGWETRHSDFPY